MFCCGNRLFFFSKIVEDKTCLQFVNNILIHFGNSSDFEFFPQFNIELKCCILQLTFYKFFVEFFSSRYGIISSNFWFFWKNLSLILRKKCWLLLGSRCEKNSSNFWLFDKTINDFKNFWAFNIESQKDV